MDNVNHLTGRGHLMALGARIMDLRASRGLTQAELRGDRYTHAYISMTEAGKKQPPPRDAELSG